MARELPRVLVIYDIDIPEPDARQTIKNYFYANGQIKDQRVNDMLVEKGYMELEETLLQHKQRSHLMRLFEGYTTHEGGARKHLLPDATSEEIFLRE
eukprot:CAMPEP_0172496066 /NCGR_PEP_ID=MMETSP1066-20121228/81093_1 /TAXON_ID=671091 /ORGANISM="Coscinodiscus wailesii, Strain CCMP2513" /LENGTH=96 /DNA_ID=CAMNT_0013268155 /DNA_START=162 /DNA_END=452 /DNA_ORIENTATION=+